MKLLTQLQNFVDRLNAIRATKNGGSIDSEGGNAWCEDASTLLDSCKDANIEQQERKVREITSDALVTLSLDKWIERQLQCTEPVEKVMENLQDFIKGHSHLFKAQDNREIEDLLVLLKPYKGAQPDTSPAATAPLPQQQTPSWRPADTRTIGSLMKTFEKRRYSPIFSILLGYFKHLPIDKDTLL